MISSFSGWVMIKTSPNTNGLQMKLCVLSSMLVVCVAVSGCESVPGPLDVSELCARSELAAEGFPSPTIHDEFEILARTVPGGFAGVTSDQMFLKHTEFAETVRESARRLGSC